MANRLKVYNGTSWIYPDVDTVDGKHADNTPNNIALLDASGLVPVDKIPSHGNHIPSGGISGQILRWSSAGVATWGADNNNVYSFSNLTIQGNGTTITTFNSQSAQNFNIKPGTNISITNDTTNKAITINNTYSYTHPTGAGNNHLPSGGATGQYLKYSSSGTATWYDPFSTNVTINGSIGANGMYSDGDVFFDGDFEVAGHIIGTFDGYLFTTTSDPVNPGVGKIWLRTDL